MYFSTDSLLSLMQPVEEINNALQLKVDVDLVIQN